MNSKKILAQKANSVVDEMITAFVSLKLMQITQQGKRSAHAEHFIAAG